MHICDKHDILRVAQHNALCESSSYPMAVTVSIALPLTPWPLFGEGRQEKGKETVGNRNGGKGVREGSRE